MSVADPGRKIRPCPLSNLAIDLSLLQRKSKPEILHEKNIKLAPSQMSVFVTRCGHQSGMSGSATDGCVENSLKIRLMCKCRKKTDYILFGRTHDSDAGKRSCDRSGIRVSRLPRLKSRVLAAAAADVFEGTGEKEPNERTRCCHSSSEERRKEEGRPDEVDHRKSRRN